MIFGIGIDLIELERIKEAIDRNEKFIERILSDEELKLCPINKIRKIEFIAGRFSAKEAVAKAVGTGIGKNLSWKDIEISNLDNGKPMVIIKKKDLIPANSTIHISISHSKSSVISKVIIEY